MGFQMLSAGACVLAMTAACATVSEPQLGDTMTEVMEETGARGLAVSTTGADRETVLTVARGERNEAGDPLTSETVMYGASLTKSAFGYLVLMLVDDGLLELDRPIAAMLPKPLPEYEGFRNTHAPWETLDDERWRRITPRMALTHTTGFRNFNFVTLEGELNWDNGTVDIHFDPGTRFSYSGDAFILLQFALEQGLGVDVGEEFRERIFRPLGMEKTDLIWRDDFAENLADGWDINGEPEPHDDRSKVRASGSMDTTIKDVSRLFSAMAACEGLSKSSCEELTKPSFLIRTKSLFPLMQEDGPEDEQYPTLAAAIGGYVIEGPQGTVLFKGGHNNITGNMAVCLIERQQCTVILANDVRAERGFPKIIRETLGETGVPWEWEYPALDLID
ncbi:serine hydrolase domain-containing protein [Parvularcula lutaonensis]|uniref:Serine hydrolase domain-containing protein n=1 Tax=Parvularcula lutaonensis TaxID=491923 RepID=A0ABV7MGY2_9PROT|nr:serine hydrolase [Parvularcula lutaonensis]GGY55193.1 serine hydrolase [Parvularcula lutaonensis]